MEEGINLSVVMSGATLIGIIGLLVRVWIAGRAQKIEQPIETCLQNTSIKHCDERHHKNDCEHENIFARIAALERQSSRVESELRSIGSNVTEVKETLNKLLFGRPHNDA